MPLMEARENPQRGMRVNLAGLLVGSLDVDEPLEKLQPVIPLPDIFPKIRNRIINIPNGPWVPRSTSPSWPVAPDVERQELGIGSLKPCGDEGPVGVDGEVYERPLGEEKIVRVPVAVLDNGVVSVLPGVRVLQLGSGDGQPVDEERHVHRQLRIPEAEVQLPRDGENVRVVLIERALRERMPRPEVREVNLNPPVFHPLPQHIQHAPRVDLGSNPQRELPLRDIRVTPVKLDKPAPALDLRPPHELPQRPGLNPQLSTEQPGGVFPAAPQQLVLNPILKRPLGMRSRTHTATPRAVVMSTCPVTAAVIRACRRSARTASWRLTSSACAVRTSSWL